MPAWVRDELGGPLADVGGEQHLPARRRDDLVRAGVAESGRERWSATEKQRSSETSSPQNSMRTGDSAVGGKRSTIPPRTANSPRFSTISTRA